MLTLFSFGPQFGLQDASPFVLKVDLYLRLTNTPYQAVSEFSNLQKAPKKKLPFVNLDGRVIADSYFILDYLEAKQEQAFDAWLSPEQQSQANLYCRALEEHMYWLLVYSRWIGEDTWPVIKEVFFAPVPKPFRGLIANLARNDVRKKLQAQGLGRHNYSELKQLLSAHLHDLANLLGEQNYFFGERISRFDLTAFAVLSQFILADIDNEFNRLARDYPNLVAYCQRIQTEFYPELA